MYINALLAAKWSNYRSPEFVLISTKKETLFNRILLWHSKKWRRNAPWNIQTQVSEIIVRWVFHSQIHRNHTERFVGVGKLRSSIFSGLQSYQKPTIFDNFAVLESTFLFPMLCAPFWAVPFFNPIWLIWKSNMLV